MTDFNLGSAPNTTSDAKFDWLTRCMRRLGEWVRTPTLRSMTFANLPSSPLLGMLVVITDSSTVTAGATIAGGGANTVLAWYNNAGHWTVVGT